MEPVLQWLRGDLATPGSAWNSLWPVFLIGGYFLGGLALYVLRTLAIGRYHDREVEERGSSAVLGSWARSYFAWLMRPIWALLLASGIPANAITTLSVLVSMLAGVAIAAGHFSLGGWLYILSGCCDFFDGRLARRTGSAGPAGAALDSVLDRYSESAVLFGLAWFYRDSWVLLCVLLTLAGSFLVSYVRARGEGLGVVAKVGLMQRPERLALLGGALALAPLLEVRLTPDPARPENLLTVIGLVVLAISTQITALRRLLFVVRELDRKPGVALLSRGRGSLLRNIVAAAVATGIDFAVVVGLVSRAGLSPEYATGCGCLVGALVNFAINRLWTFSANGTTGTQVLRYSIASSTGAVLNASGVAVLLLLPDLDYQLAWLLARVAIFLGWSYPLHKSYVFRHGTPEPHELDIETAGVDV